MPVRPTRPLGASQSPQAPVPDATGPRTAAPTQTTPQPHSTPAAVANHDGSSSVSASSFGPAPSTSRAQTPGSLLRARRPWSLRPKPSAVWKPAPAPPAVTLGGASLPETQRFPLGAPVTATIRGARVDGHFAGFDYKGRAVLIDRSGERRIAPFSQLHAAARSGQGAEASAAPTGASRAIDTLPAAARLAAPTALKKAMDAALAVPVVGTYTAKAYLDAFAARGYEAYVVGGAVRDVVELLAKNPHASQAELVALLHDIDIVTTAPPPVARQICEALAKDLPGGGVWSPTSVEQFGVVLAGGPKSSVGGAGIDIASMKSAGYYAPRQKQTDIGETVVPTTFAADLVGDAKARDFCANALYYDAQAGLILDPTGQGVADAENRLLRPARNVADLCGDTTLSPRFFKFRLRGWDGDGEAIALVRKHAEWLFQPTSGEGVYNLTSTLGRVAPKDAKDRPAVERWLKDFERVMDEDGAGPIFRAGISGGRRDYVIREVLKRTARGGS